MNLGAAKPIAELLSAVSIEDTTLRRALAKELSRALLDDSSDIQHAIDGYGEDDKGRLDRLIQSLINAYRSLTRDAVMNTEGLEEKVLDRAALRLPRHWLGKAMLLVVALQFALLGISIPVFQAQFKDIQRIQADALQGAKDAKAAADQAKIDARTYQLEIARQLNDALGMKQDAVMKARDLIVKTGTEELGIQGLKEQITRRADSQLSAALYSQENKVKKLERSVGVLNTKVFTTLDKIDRINNAVSTADVIQRQADVLHRVLMAQKETVGDTAIRRIVWSAYQIVGWTLIAVVFIAILAFLFSLIAMRRALKIGHGAV